VLEAHYDYERRQGGEPGAASALSSMICADSAIGRDACVVTSCSRALLGRERRPPLVAGGLRHRFLNKVHQTKRQQCRRNDDIAQAIETLQIASGTLRNDDAGDYRGDAA
jgi:hypothetical protein